MKKTILSTIAICGACISFYIGAGFATMQEVVQYEASYGSLFGVVVLVAMAIYIYTNISFATNGNRLALKRGGDIMKYILVFSGKSLASVRHYFSTIFLHYSVI